MLKSEALLRSFVFGCREAGITDSEEVAVLPEIHLCLLKKMVHTHGNEVLENRRMLSGLVIEVPLMLRDSLKTMAAQSKTKSS